MTLHIDKNPRRGMIFARLLAIALGFLSVAASAQSDNDAYELSIGDKVKVTVYGHEDLSGEFEVDASGNVSLPLIGDVAATKQTANELEGAIIEALRPDYLKNPRVSVELLTYQPFYIFGEVNAPGSYPYTAGMTVIRAVAVAGGFTYRARKNRIRIVRGDEENSVEIEASEATPIKPGDIIEVPERFF